MAHLSLRTTIYYYPGYPGELDRVSLPLICRSVTRFHGRAGDQGNYVAKSYWHLEWVDEGGLLMKTAEGEHRIPAGAAVIVPPGLERRFVVEDIATGCGMSVVGAQAEPIIRSLGYTPPGIRHPGACPIADFRQLEEEVGAMSDRDMRAASATAYRILTKAFSPVEAAGVKDHDPLVVRAIDLLDKSFSDPLFNVNRLAQELGCHRCHLTHRFQEQTGVSPADYLMRRRLQKAMNALRTSRYSVAEVAETSGFTTADYFSRIFRQKVGMTPSHFRLKG